MKYIIPMAIVFHAPGEAQARKLKDELAKLVQDTDVKVALAGAAVSAGANASVQTVIGDPRVST